MPAFSDGVGSADAEQVAGIGQSDSITGFHAEPDDTGFRLGASSFGKRGPSAIAVEAAGVAAVGCAGDGCFARVVAVPQDACSRRLAACLVWRRCVRFFNFAPPEWDERGLARFFCGTDHVHVFDFARFGSG